MNDDETQESGTSSDGPEKSTDSKPESAVLVEEAPPFPTLV